MNTQNGKLPVLFLWEKERDIVYAAFLTEKHTNPQFISCYNQIEGYSNYHIEYVSECEIVKECKRYQNTLNQLINSVGLKNLLIANEMEITTTDGDFLLAIFEKNNL